MKKFLLAFVAVTIAAASNASAADYGPADIEKAIGTYKANEVRFARDYAGKSIAFTWTFHNARARLFGGGYRVNIGNGGIGGNVDCTVTDQTLLDKIVEWNKGQRIQVSGIIDDVTFGDLQLKQCKIEAL